MPAIGNHLDNFVKVNLSCECNETHDDFDFKNETKNKNSPEYKLINDPVVVMQQQATGSRIISFMLLCILTIWFTLAFWLIVSPPAGYSRSLCSDLLYGSANSIGNGAKEEILQKLHKEMEQFSQLTTLYGQYYNLSSDKISKASQDPNLWYVVFSIMIEREMKGEIKQTDTIMYKLTKARLLGRDYFNSDGIRMAETIKRDIDKLKQFYRTMSEKKDAQSEKIIGEYDTGKYLLDSKYDSKKSHNNQELEAKRRPNDTHSTRFSANESYLLYDRIAYGEKYNAVSMASQVTLVTQSSMDRINSFLASASRWTGPISLAVFLNGPAEYFLFRSYIAYVKRCYRDIYDRTCFSVASPTRNPIPRGASIQTSDFDFTLCSAMENVIDEKLKKNTADSKEWLKTNWYPQNTMRNLAKYNALTPYHLTLDIDIIPCAKMSEALNKFFKNKPIEQTALVIPTYEVSKKAKFPANKAELVSLSRKGQAQPFHKDTFALNQASTNFTKWEKIHDTFNDIRIVHEVPKFQLYYEPFFVEHTSSPLYNETFVGYGFTRSSHAYEMYLKYGNFKVLSPIFTVQLGLQKVKQWSAERQQQNEHNRRLFEDFVKNLNNQTHKHQIVEFFFNKS